MFFSINIFSQAFGGGNGTSRYPYRIYTKQHLEELAYLTNTPSTGWTSKDQYFILMNDITDSFRTVIGYKEGRGFRGNFNGQGHKITLALENIYPDTSLSSQSDNCGLFGKMFDAYISNVVVDGCIKVIHYNSKPNKTFDVNVGAIVGISFTSVIENCMNMANIYVGNKLVPLLCLGGIAGNILSSPIINCVNTGKIEQLHSDTNKHFYWYIGGIVGLVNPFTIDNEIINCVNIGTIIVKNVGYIGGICGIGADYESYSSAVIKNCVNSGLIIGGGYLLSGIVSRESYNVNATIITKCVNTGVIIGTNDSTKVGGIAIGR